MQLSIISDLLWRDQWVRLTKIRAMLLRLLRLRRQVRRDVVRVSFVGSRLAVRLLCEQILDQSSLSLRFRPLMLYDLLNGKLEHGGHNASYFGLCCTILFRYYGYWAFSWPHCDPPLLNGGCRLSRRPWTAIECTASGVESWGCRMTNAFLINACMVLGIFGATFFASGWVVRRFSSEPKSKDGGK